MWPLQEILTTNEFNNIAYTILKNEERKKNRETENYGEKKKQTAQLAFGALVQNLTHILREFLGCLYGMMCCIIENINDRA